MDSNKPSLELLDHFDRPKLLLPSEAAWIDETEDSQQQPLSTGKSRLLIATRLAAVRDVRWILKWASALSVIVIAVSQLIAFAYLCEAEHVLDLAARAGASESTLPHATYATISAAVENRLTGYPQLRGRLRLTVLQNTRPIGRQFRAGEGDRISVTISVTSSELMPSWLTKLPTWRGDVLLSARADRVTPSHRLRPEHSQTAAE